MMVMEPRVDPMPAMRVGMTLSTGMPAISAVIMDTSRSDTKAETFILITRKRSRSTEKSAMHSNAVVDIGVSCQAEKCE